MDVSQDAMDAVARNARLNGVSVQCVTDNAFDFLKKEAALVRDGGEHKWDLIILDPPSFTRNKKPCMTPCADIRKSTSAP